jgi:hypothetical protein
VLAGLLVGLLPELVGQRVCAWLSRLPGVGSVSADLWRALWLYRSRRTAVVGAVLLAALGHASIPLDFYFASQIFSNSGVSEVPSLAEHFLIIPTGLLFQAFFPSPGGVGGGEYGFGQLYALVGKPVAQGVLGSLAVRFITLGACLAGSLFYLCARARLCRDLADENQPSIDQRADTHLSHGASVLSRDNSSRLAG